MAASDSDQSLFLRAWTLTKSLFRYAVNRYRRLPLYGKLLFWAFCLLEATLAVLVIIITPATIAQFVHDKAVQLAALKFGWILLGGLIVLVSFPPLIGHTTLTLLNGFTYGFTRGFLLSATASLLGSTIVFLTLRALFGRRLRRWSKDMDKWRALEAIVEAKGLPLIILIRVSPFPPWVYSNTMFASIKSVRLWQFVVATLFVFPKLLLQSFIGSRMAALSDGEERGRMDTQTKVINGLSIAAGILIGSFASWSVYRLMDEHIRAAEELSPEEDRLAAEAVEEYGEESPLLLPSSPTS